VRAKAARRLHKSEESGGGQARRTSKESHMEDRSDSFANDDFSTRHKRSKKPTESVERRRMTTIIMGRDTHLDCETEVDTAVN